MEEFFKDYHHTFSALGVIGTFLAVIVALYLSNRQYKSKVRASVFKAITVDGNMIGDGIPELYDSKNNEEYIAITIKNTGLSPVIIPCQFQYISMPFCKYQDRSRSLGFIAWISRKFDLPIWSKNIIFDRPLTIISANTQQFPINIDSKSSVIIRVSTKEQLIDTLKNYHWIQLHFLQWVIMTSDNIFKAKISNALKKEIRNVKK